MGKTFKTIDDAVIRFAGDSGDGMQLTGGRFTETTAVVGNDLSTLPDFPAEILDPVLLLQEKPYKRKRPILPPSTRKRHDGHRSSLEPRRQR